MKASVSHTHHERTLTTEESTVGRPERAIVRIPAGPHIPVLVHGDQRAVTAWPFGTGGSIPSTGTSRRYGFESRPGRMVRWCNRKHACARGRCRAAKAPALQADFGGFDSLRLHWTIDIVHLCVRGGTGRRPGLRSRCPDGRAGSTPAERTLAPETHVDEYRALTPAVEGSRPSRRTGPWSAGSLPAGCGPTAVTTCVTRPIPGGTRAQARPAASGCGVAGARVSGGHEVAGSIPASPTIGCEPRGAAPGLGPGSAGFDSPASDHSPVVQWQHTRL